jgi:hypothetical protein
MAVSLNFLDVFGVFLDMFGVFFDIFRSYFDVSGIRLHPVASGGEQW